MTPTIILASYDSRAVALVLAVLMLAAWGAGWLMGRRLRKRKVEVDSTFDGASLALLGLLLAFTFSMSLSKHEERRLMIVADSNAIAGFYTCASLLKDPTRAQLQDVIHRYAEIRLDLAQRRLLDPRLAAGLQQAEQLQGEMTELVRAAVNEGTPIAVPLTNALNNLTSTEAEQLAAFRDRLPALVLLLLFTCTLAASMLVGREQGASGNLEIAGTISYVVLVSLAVYVMLDLNQPVTGTIKVNLESIRRLVASMPR